MPGTTETGPRVDVDPIIDCIDCGGRCHLLTTWPPDDPPQAGDVVSYRCADCLDVWYLVIPEEEAEDL